MGVKLSAVGKMVRNLVKKMLTPTGLGSTLGTKRLNILAFQQKSDLLYGPNSLNSTSRPLVANGKLDVHTIDKPPGLAALRCERGDGGEGTASTSKTSSNWSSSSSKASAAGVGHRAEPTGCGLRFACARAGGVVT